MKKYLLTSLLGVFAFLGIFSFASAGTINISYGGDGEGYFPDSLSDYGSMDYITVDSYDCDLNADLNGNCDLIINDEEKQVCAVSYSYGSIADNCSSISPVGELMFYSPDGYFTSLSLSYGISNSGGNSGGDSGNSSSPLLSGGIVQLSGVIIVLGNVIDEFMPYLVYLGLGIIVAVIGFVAIRWLVNRTSAKVRGTFSSGKRKR